MGVDLDAELVKVVKYLKNQGKTRHQVSNILKISWATANKYWEDNTDALSKLKSMGMEDHEISREDFKILYKLFEEGKTVVEVVKETGLYEIAHKVYAQYCDDKGVRHASESSLLILILRIQIKELKKKSNDLDARLKKIEESDLDDQSD
jgi:hypothetical protein